MFKHKHDIFHWCYYYKIDIIVKLIKLYNAIHIYVFLNCYQYKSYDQKYATNINMVIYYVHGQKLRDFNAHKIVYSN